MEKSGKYLKLFFAVSLLSALLALPAASAADVNSVTVCRGEQAVFEFELHNKADPLTYNITPSGLGGVLSISRISLGPDERVNFTFTVPTSDKAYGNYPFTMIADGGPTVSTASSLLVVANCYDSFLSASPSAITANACTTGKTTLTLQNRGTKSDSFTLTSSGDLGLTFAPATLQLGGGSSGTSEVAVSVPCTVSAGSHVLTLTANGVSKSSANLNVVVVIPSPTPVPQGCTYDNPACVAPQVCQNNKCVLPPGCKYHNPDCAAGFVCDTAANVCKEIPKVPAPILSSEVQYDVCRGEKVRYDYQVTNPANASQTYAVTIDGVTGVLSPSSSIAVPAGQKKAFSLEVDTASLAPKTYFFNVLASNGEKSVTMQSGLKVNECYSSGLSLQTGTLELCPTQVKTRTVTVRNLGSQADVFTLSAKDAGDLKVEFQPSSLLVGPGEEKSSLALFTAPAEPASIAAPRTVTIQASSNSVSSAQISVSIKDPATCPLAFNPALYLSAVRVCTGETARLNFDILNPSEFDQEFVLKSSGVAGVLSQGELAVKSKSTANFFLAVNTTGLALGKYPVEILAKSDRAFARVSSQLQVEDCFGSNLTLVKIVSGGQVIPVESPAPATTVAPSAPAATPSPAAKAQSGVLKILGLDGIVLESGLERKVTLAVQNTGGFDVTGIRLFVNNVSVSDYKPLAMLKSGEQASVEVTLSSDASSPFNTTARAVGEEGNGENAVAIRATPSKLTAQAVKTSVQKIGNGTRENVTVTVRISNLNDKQLNLTLEAKESSVRLLGNSALSLKAGASAEIMLNAELPSGREYNATLVAVTGKGTYKLPVTLNTKTGGVLTGLFTGGAASMLAIAAVVLAVVFVLLYLAKKQTDAEEQSEEKEEGSAAKEAKKAKKKAED